MDPDISVNQQTEDIIQKLLNRNPKQFPTSGIKTQLKDGFFRRQLFLRYKSKCAKCSANGKQVKTTKKGKTYRNTLDIHHNTYNWYCPHQKAGKISCKAKNCYRNYPKKFNDCLDNCMLLCHSCHYSQHIKNKKEKGTWTPSREIPAVHDLEHNVLGRKNQGKHWKVAEDEKLKHEFKCGSSIETISKLLKRSNRSIMFRLRRLNLIDEEEFNKIDP